MNEKELVIDELEDVIKCACASITVHVLHVCLGGVLREVGIIKPSTST